MEKEWTSFNDIGKKFNNKEFTFADYIIIENAYVNAIQAFMCCLKINNMTVRNLEKFELNDVSTTTNYFSKELLDIHAKVKENETISIDEIQTLCRLILREKLWCKLLNQDNMFVHFGYDYYMYIGSSENCKDTIKTIEDLGLFVEKVESPYND